MASTTISEGDHLNFMFRELIDEGRLACAEVEKIMKTSGVSLLDIEKFLREKGISSEEILRCAAESHTLPFLEYSESLVLSEELLELVNLEKLKTRFWCPLSIYAGTGEVVVFDPTDEKLAEEIKHTLGVDNIKYVIALPSDIVRIIDNNQDINPGYPKFSARTALAKLRTFLAGERVALAHIRTTLAKGRTGLALIRTGLAFFSIGLVLLRVFGIGIMSLLEVPLICCGLTMAVEGVQWYLPSRRIDRNRIDYPATEATFGTTVLHVNHAGEILRTPPVEGAGKLRKLWNRLSPVMKRRFLAIDRTDLADERTILASYRTKMALARTGLAFTRTGVSFVGLGIALARQFKAGWWSILDIALMFVGLIMVSEGFRWYIWGRKAGVQGLDAVQNVSKKSSIWDFIFPPHHTEPDSDDSPLPLFLHAQQAPGILGTTGLALERTLIADRRNVKSRLRTVMARSRTGMAFIRTGSSIFSVGFGLLVYFGMGNTFMSVLNVFLILVGLAFICDGLYWHVPAERLRAKFAHCMEDMEIPLVDYGKPTSSWKRVVFSYDDL